MQIPTLEIVPQHGLWKHFVDLAYRNLELSDRALLSETAIFLQKATNKA